MAGQDQARKRTTMRGLGRIMEDNCAVAHEADEMSTTTLRLPEELKVRIAKLAEESSKTSPSLMLEAIAQKWKKKSCARGFTRMPTAVSPR